MLARFRRRFSAWRQLRSGRLYWHGTTVYFPRGSLVAASIARTGGWEPAVAAVLATAARAGGVVLDVGANIGGSVVPLLAAYPDLTAVSYEPSPTVLPYLSRTRDECRFQDRWSVVAKAVTAVTEDEVTFIRFLGSGGDVYDGLRDTGRGGAGVSLRVPTTSVDAEWAALGRPTVSVLKVDVEGAELGVLAGATECLRVCRPVVVTEWCRANFTVYGYSPFAVLDAAAEAGYVPYVLPEVTRADRLSFEYQLSTRENLLLLPAERSEP